MLARMIKYLNQSSSVINLDYDKNGWSKKSFFMDKDGTFKVNESIINKDGSYENGEKYPTQKQYPISDTEALELISEKLKYLCMEVQQKEEESTDNDCIITDGSYYMNTSYSPTCLEFLTTFKGMATKMDKENADNWLIYIRNFTGDKYYNKFEVVKYN